jgi:hypothetical protein
MPRGYPNDDPTLPIAADPALAPPASAGTSGVRRVVSAPGRRSGLELGALAAVAIVGSVVWLGLRDDKPKPVAAAPSAITQPASVQVALVQVAPAQVASAQVVAIQANTGLASAATGQPKKVLVSGAPPKAKPVAQQLVAPSDASTLSAETKPRAVEPPAGDVGPSALIESLIEQRH